MPYRIIINKFLGNRIIFPFYHLVSDEECPHIRHLYSVKGTTEFKKELDFFQKYFQPIELNELMQHIRKGTSPEKPSFFLSFDDGLKECHSVIAPILKERNLTAAFFLNTAFVDNKALFYRYKVSLLIDHLEKTNANPPYTKRELLKMNYADTGKIDRAGAELGVDFDRFARQQRPYMGWPEIEELKNDGFFIGAHSVDHPQYNLIRFEEQLSQTRKSTDKVVDGLNLNYRIFSFPFTDYGVGSSFFNHIYQNKIVDLSFGTAGIKDDVFTKNLQRLPMDNCHHSVEYFILKNICLYRLKKLLNKNTVLH